MEELIKQTISIEDKVFIWLIINDKKPSCTVELPAKYFNRSNNTFIPKKSSLIKLIGFFDKNNLSYKYITKEDTRMRKNEEKVKQIYYLFLVSKDKIVSSKLFDLFTDPRGIFYPEINEQIGILLGYPKKAVEIYAKSMVTPNEFPKELMTVNNFYDKYKNENWVTYCRYIVRKDNSDEDIKIAKEWSEFTKKTFPELAKIFEKEMKKSFQLIK